MTTWTKLVLLVPGDREACAGLFDAVAELAHEHAEAQHNDWYLDSLSGSYASLTGL